MLILILICVGMVLLFIGIGLKIMNSTYPVQYMANANELPEISDIKGYNHALGRTFIGFGCILIPIFIPLFLPMPIPLIMVFCMPFWTIGLILRCMQIQSKYEK